MVKKIVEWTQDTITLNDGTLVEIVESEQDCCASAGDIFKDVTLDAVITNNVEKSDIISNTSYDETDNEITITIYHNQNPIALAECYANDGNGGYYSVCSFKINKIHYEVVSA